MSVSEGQLPLELGPVMGRPATHVVVVTENIKPPGIGFVSADVKLIVHRGDENSCNEFADENGGQVCSISDPRIQGLPSSDR